MNKIICVVCFLVLMPVFCIAADLVDNIDATKLSTGVEGTYFVDTALDNFVISTGHEKGNKAFATGNFTTKLYQKDGTGTKGQFQTSDLIAVPTTYDATAFSGFAVIGATSSS